MTPDLAAVSPLSPEIVDALIIAAATGLTGLLGFAAIVWQIGAQGRQAINAAKFNEAVKLKLQVYERFADASGKAASAGHAFHTHLVGFDTAIRWMNEQERLGQPIDRPHVEYRKFEEVVSDFVDATAELVDLIPQWQKIDSRLLIFRDALAIALADIVHRHQSELVPVLMALDQTGTQLIPQWQPPAAGERHRIRQIVQGVLSPVLDVLGHVEDLSAAAQTLLLEPLFPGNVEIRRPLDPAVTVITLDNAQALRKQYMSRIEESGREAMARHREADSS